MSYSLLVYPPKEEAEGPVLVDDDNLAQTWEEQEAMWHEQEQEALAMVEKDLPPWRKKRPVVEEQPWSDEAWTAQEEPPKKQHVDTAGGKAYHELSEAERLAVSQASPRPLSVSTDPPWQEAD